MVFRLSWFEGWGNRVQITIDSGDVNTDLLWFPVLIHLSSSCGRNGDDLTDVFNKIGGNSKKIMVTQEDGLTPLYAEIEEWDTANKEAWLWVSRDGWVIDSANDTVLYLYYDSLQQDNVGYVGDPNSVVAENVWDANYVFVSHMRDDPDTSHIRDSTSNDNDGTKKGANEPIVTTSGVISDAQDFDGTDDYVELYSTNPHLDGQNFTIMGWFKPEPNGKYQFLWYKWRPNVLITPALQTFIFELDDGTYKSVGVNTPVSNKWYFLVQVLEGSTHKAYVYDENGLLGTAERSDIGTTQGSDTVKFRVSREGWFGNNSMYKGLADEVRISDKARSSAWITACYETQRDDLLDYGGVETKPLKTSNSTRTLNALRVINPRRVLNPIRVLS